jgi:catechol 2,3-dioxygenase-like lactoylglutathione lyase family enzyme
MFSHIMVGADDIEAARRFYDATFTALGHQPGFSDDKGRLFYRSDRGVFAVTAPIDGQPAHPGNGYTIGLTAPSAEAAQAWHAAGVANGGTTCEDPPGVRDSPMGKLYLAYLRDPAGNKLCALHAMG